MEGDKTYQCGVCEKAFTSSSNLSSHMNTHTGDKPYSCDICQKSFTQAGSRDLHKKKHFEKSKKKNTQSQSMNMKPVYVKMNKLSATEIKALTNPQENVEDIKHEIINDLDNLEDFPLDSVVKEEPNSEEAVNNPYNHNNDSDEEYIGDEIDIKYNIIDPDIIPYKIISNNVVDSDEIIYEQNICLPPSQENYINIIFIIM